MLNRIVITPFKFLASAFALSLLLPQLPASAQTDGSHKIVSSGFEQIIGRELNSAEDQQVNLAIQQLRNAQSQVQQPSAVTELWERYEKLPVICMYGKFDGQIPFSKKGIKLSGLSIGYEITPCLVLNSFDPLEWRVNEFRSYIMQGGSFSSNGFGGLAGGILVGVYAGPKSLVTPMVGTYGFVRFTAEPALVKFAGQIAYGSDHQVFALVGVGGELSFDAILHALKVIPKIEANSVEVAGVKAEVGMYFSVKEFPWFQRLVLQRQSPTVAFADMKAYFAANN